MGKDLSVGQSTTVVIADSEISPQASVWRRAWERWKRIAHAIGVVQTRIIMFLFFIVVVLPVGLILRLLRDPLHFKHPERTNWTPHRQEPHTLESAQRQF